jgi:hypothetical protein
MLVADDSVKKDQAGEVTLSEHWSWEGIRAWAECPHGELGSIGSFLVRGG